MRESSSVASARADGIPGLAGPGPRPTRGPPASTAAGSPEMTLRLTDDHDRIADGLNDLVARRLFTAGLDLEAARGLTGEHRAAGRIQHAISELDLAIRDIRDIVFATRREAGLGALRCC
jgi:signal transduction histidine kinase